MSQGWDILHKRAKSLEGSIERKIQSYSSVAQRINANFLCDEENSLLESSDEQSLASEIERELGELYECIQSMRQINNGVLTNQQEVWIKRYYEIHFDYSTEFKSTSATVQRKRESMELLQNTKNMRSEEQDSSVAKLLKEKMSIAASMRSINEVISQAFETKNSLTNQRNTLNNSSGGLTSLSSNVPGIGRLIEGIQKKKTKESMVIAIVVGVLLCFTIWWLFLR